MGQGGMKLSKTKQIGDLEVTTTKLPTLRGSRLRMKVNRLLMGNGQKIEGGELTAELFTGFLADLPDADADTLILESLVSTVVVRDDAQGSKIKFDLSNLSQIDLAFDGDDLAMWQSVLFSWEVNLANPTKGVAVKPDPAP